MGQAQIQIQIQGRGINAFLDRLPNECPICFYAAEIAYFSSGREEKIYNLGASSTSTGAVSPTTSLGNSILDQRYLINRDLSSWIISLGAEVRNNQGTTTAVTTQNALSQYSAVIAVTLKDAPNIMIQNAFGAPNSSNRQGALPLTPMPSY